MKNGNDMKRKFLYTIITICLICSFFSCEQNDLLTNANDVSYVIFDKDMTTDTTAVSFKFYDEGEDAKIALGVKVYGKLQENDLTFSLGFDPVRTTFLIIQHQLGIVFKEFFVSGTISICDLIFVVFEVFNSFYEEHQKKASYYANNQCRFKFTF